MRPHSPSAPTQQVGNPRRACLGEEWVMDGGALVGPEIIPCRDRQKLCPAGAARELKASLPGTKPSINAQTPWLLHCPTARDFQVYVHQLIRGTYKGTPASKMVGWPVDDHVALSGLCIPAMTPATTAPLIAAAMYRLLFCAQLATCPASSSVKLASEPEADICGGSGSRLAALGSLPAARCLHLCEVPWQGTCTGCRQ